MSGAAPITAEVAVIGGGPAGSAAALTLAQYGIDTVLIEASDYSRQRIGETFAPEIAGLLAELGLVERARATSIESYGIRSVWGGDQVEERSHVCRPHRVGWHVDRAAFDRALALGAEAAGVRLLTGTRVTDARYDGGCWAMTIGVLRDERTVVARYAIDATGRRAQIARGAGARRAQSDPLTATVFRFENVNLQDYAACTLIEATSCGWWYSAPTPHDRAVAVFFNNARTLRSSAPSLVEEEAPLTAQRHARLAKAEVSRWPAGSSRLDMVFGPGWLAVGDAGMTVDPISGDGVARALASGRAGALAIAADRQGDTSAVAAYAASIEATFHRYAQTRAMHYSMEQRWADLPFWTWAHSLDGNRQGSAPVIAARRS